jgi:hypothetical protein
MRDAENFGVLFSSLQSRYFEMLLACFGCLTLLAFATL